MGILYRYGIWKLWFNDDSIAHWLMLYRVERKEIPTEIDKQIIYYYSSDMFGATGRISAIS